MLNIFISALPSQAQAARRIAGILEGAGYTVEVGLEAAPRKTNTLRSLEEIVTGALKKAERVLPVVDREYLAAFGDTNYIWMMASFGHSPFDTKSQLLPVQVGECGDLLTGFVDEVFVPMAKLAYQLQLGVAAEAPPTIEEKKLLEFVRNAGAQPSGVVKSTRPEEADYFVSASSQAADRAAGEAIAELLEQTGQQVVCLWKCTVTPSVIARAPALIAVFTQAYEDEHLPEWDFFSGGGRSQASGGRGGRRSARNQLVFAFTENYGIFSGMQRGSTYDLVPIDLRSGTDAEKSARLLAALGLPVPRVGALPSVRFPRSAQRDVGQTYLLPSWPADLIVLVAHPSDRVQANWIASVLRVAGRSVYCPWTDGTHPEPSFVETADAVEHAAAGLIVLSTRFVRDVQTECIEWMLLYRNWQSSRGQRRLYMVRIEDLDDEGRLGLLGRRTGSHIDLVGLTGKAQEPQRQADLLYAMGLATLPGGGTMPTGFGNYCTACGFSNTGTARFCRRCGTSMSLVTPDLSHPNFCPDCGSNNPPTAPFCRACGTLMGVLPTASQATPVSGSVSGSGGASSTTGMLSAQLLLRGRYLIRARLGQGGMGAVYQASDEQFGGRPVAIKEMGQSGLSAQELAEATAAFKHETMLLAGLRHPMLPAIYDHFAEGGKWYLVMDFITGESVAQYQKRVGVPFDPGNPSETWLYLPVTEVLDIGVRLTRVLSYLHSRTKPIIFRDLKPANVMRAESGGEVDLYLIDFGIARLFTPGKSKDTAALGSPGYAAPEQYGKATSPQSDIYSLGATLHHLVTGIDPSETGNPFEKAPLSTVAHLRGLPILVELDALLQQMVEMTAGKRPASMEEVRTRLLSLYVRP